MKIPHEDEGRSLMQMLGLQTTPHESCQKLRRSMRDPRLQPRLFGGQDALGFERLKEGELHRGHAIAPRRSRASSRALFRAQSRQ